MDSQRMRFLPGKENQGAQAMWQSFCYNQALKDVNRDSDLLRNPIKKDKPIIGSGSKFPSLTHHRLPSC